MSSMTEDPGERLERSWIANADGWTRAVREGQLESRRLVTDSAIMQALLERSPRSALDIGCGEGWLARALAERGVAVVGLDASAPLIDAARAQGGGTFHLRSYTEFASSPEAIGSCFDAAIFNFALLEEQVAPVLRAVQRILARSGRLYIQTVHPWAACGAASYRDGWRTETFAGFGAGFPEPMPWYFRTLESWVALLRQSGYWIEDLREPIHPATAQPLSLLVVARPAAEPTVAANTGPCT